MAGIKMVNVKKQYPNGFVAIESMNLDIPDKEFVVLVGPSGCAKSTALKMIAGLEEITAGEMYIGDRLVNDVPPKDREIAMVFQSYALYPHMTIYDNIAFGLKMRKTPKEEIDKLVKEASEILGMADLLDRKPRQLSGGQRQRVALGRAIVRHPQVFLFDEPLSNLDAKLRVKMRTELKQLHQRLQTTVIYVTHDQVEAMTMGSTIVVLKLGQIQQVGSPLELYSFPANRFVAGFIGSPSMNFLDCTIAEENGATYVDTGAFKVELPADKAAKVREHGGREFIFGIRPEDMRKRREKQENYSEAHVHARINVIEPLGKEMYVNMTADGLDFMGIINARFQLAPQEDIELTFNMDRAHLFEKDGDNRSVAHTAKNATSLEDARLAESVDDD
ncbi:MAG: sn-glycerol-3-phosphate ABC transporter ATP-binding protein UgpC [Desulfosarcinaceae bacterium]|nr:sn-glycerol-3-phosphate ABC transporter ATP-binding protein UgpC [Desulfosarcinaceae bacterium]